VPLYKDEIMAANRFGMNQSSEPQVAEIVVPGCNRYEQNLTGHPRPVIFIEIENGEPIMYVYGDINQEDWTHRIELKDALESNREESAE
jgi:hypothetical protein